MKKTSFLALAIVALSGTAYGADGTVTVNGRVVSTTCEVAQNSKNIVVYLETVGANSLATAGAEAGKQPFKIQISGCSEQERVGVAFEVAEGIVASNGTLPNVAPIAGRAGNVAVALYNSGHGVDSRINLSNGSNVTQIVQTDAGAAELVYAAGYYATGAATAGNVRGVARFSVAYQ